MSLTKADLRKDILAYSNRDDISDRVDSFIRSAENKLDSVLRVPSMEKMLKADLEKDDQQLQLPKDYLELIRIYYPDSGEPLYRTSMESLPSVGLGVDYPIGYSRSGTSIYLDKPCNQDLDLIFVYYALPPRLVKDADTSVYLDVAYDAIKYLALAEVFRFLVDSEADYWVNLANIEIATLNERADEAEYAGSTLLNTYGLYDNLSDYF